MEGGQGSGGAIFAGFVPVKTQYVDSFSLSTNDIEA